MADEKKTVKKEDTSKAEKKKVNPFKRAGKAIAKFFKDLRGETKKIVWPGFRDVVKNTIIVLIMCAIVGALIWLVDLGLGSLLKAVW